MTLHERLRAASLLYPDIAAMLTEAADALDPPADALAWQREYPLASYWKARADGLDSRLDRVIAVAMGAP